MSKKLEKLKKLRATVRSYNDTIEYYNKLFAADGHIDTEEQAALDKLNASVQEVENQLHEKVSALGFIDKSRNLVDASQEAISDHWSKKDDEVDHSLVVQSVLGNENNNTEGVANDVEEGHNTEESSVSENSQDQSEEVATNTPDVTGEKVTRLTEAVGGISTTGLGGSVSASHNRAEASNDYIAEKKEVLNAAAQEHQIPVSILAAITSRESDGESALKPLSYFGYTPAQQLERIKGSITSNLSGYNFHTVVEFRNSKYGRYTLADLPGLNSDDRVWGDHGYGYGVTQFDIDWHAKKVLDMLAKSPEEAENDLISNASALLAEEMEKAKAAHSSWTEEQCMQAAIGAYNAGSTIHDGGGNYPKMGAFDANLISQRTTGGDYGHDVIARAQYYEENMDTSTAASGSAQNSAEEVTEGNGGANDNSASTTIGSSISGSVGEQGDNVYEDVLVIQKMLEAVGYSLAIDGDCGDITKGYIRDYQSKNFTWPPDGLITPNGQTWNKLVNKENNTVEASDTTSTDTAADSAETSGGRDSEPKGGYFSHPNAGNVSIGYGGNAVKLNAAAEQLLKSLVAERGHTSIYVTSTLRTYHDQARINYGNHPDDILNWYGYEVYDAWTRYRNQGRSIEEYAAYLEDRDNRTGGFISNHIPGYAIDISPYDETFARVCDEQVPVAGSGVHTVLRERGNNVVHIEFTFKVN